MNKSEAQKVLFECAELYKNNLIDYNPVSYTHLDVYKRQFLERMDSISPEISF